LDHAPHRLSANRRRQRIDGFETAIQETAPDRASLGSVDGDDAGQAHALA